MWLLLVANRIPFLKLESCSKYPALCGATGAQGGPGPGRWGEGGPHSKISGGLQGRYSQNIFESLWLLGVVTRSLAGAGGISWLTLGG